MSPLIAGLFHSIRVGSQTKGVRELNSLRRYTNLAAAIHLLRTRQITLLSPTMWEDKNDSYFMMQYRTTAKAQTVLALCFAAGTQRYHHWRVYSYGADGVRIQFNKEHLLSFVDGDCKIKHRFVKYESLRNVSNIRIQNRDDLLFIKQSPFKDEKEYRIVYVDECMNLEYKEYPIDVECITQVTLSPWMPVNLANSVKRTLKSIPGCSNLEVRRSTLTQNEKWKALAQTIQN